MERMKIVRGDTYEIILNVLSAGEAKDLTGIQSVKYTLYEDFKRTHVLYEQDNNDAGLSIPIPEEGKIYITLPSEITEKLNVQNYHKCVLIDSQGNVFTLLGDYMETFNNRFNL